MKTVVVRITGWPNPGDIIAVGYRAPRGGQTAARHDAGVNETAETVAHSLIAAIGKTWLGNDAFQIRFKEPSGLVIICTDAVANVTFFGEVTRAEGSTGDIEVSIEEI